MTGIFGLQCNKDDSERETNIRIGKKRLSAVLQAHSFNTFKIN